LGNGYAVEPIKISIFDVWSSEPRIHLYWKEAEEEYLSWGAFSSAIRWRLPELRVRAARLVEAVRGTAGKFRKIASVERFRTLQSVNEARSTNGITATAIVESYFGPRWARVEGAEWQYIRVESMLKALCELAELKEKNGRYSITGRGIAALSQYEEEERKHRESTRLQGMLRNLTYVLVVAALVQAGASLVQAGVIKLPVLLNVGI